MSSTEVSRIRDATKILFVAMVVVNILAFALALAGATDKLRSLPKYGTDLNFRMNEVSCLLSGINPHDVWIGENKTTPFAPYVDVEAVAGGKRPLHVYTPWAYAFLLPINLLGAHVGTTLYLIAIAASMFFLAWVGFRIGTSARGDKRDGMLVSAFCLMTSAAFFADLFVMNMGTIITFFVVFMMLEVARGRDFLAGICLAGAMMKPNMGMLFVVPLLIKRRFVVIAVAAVICLLATFLPSGLCGASLFNLIAQAPQSSVFAFRGCDICPWFLLRAASSMGVSPSVSILVAVVIGASACFAICWKMRRSDDWFLLFLPPATLSMAWTYTSYCNRVMTFFIFSALALMLVRGVGGRWLRFCAIPMLILLARPFEAAHTLLIFFSGILSEWQIPDGLIMPVQSAFSLAAFIPAVAILCLYLSNAAKNASDSCSIALHHPEGT